MISIENFEARVFKTNRCWLWTGALNGRGYGNLRIAGRPTYAHRVAFELYNGEAPNAALDVLHECDVPHCVNPDHLWLGTHADNMADMAAKGRKPGIRGARNHNSKLAEQQAVEILNDQRPQEAIAAHFGVSQATVSHIKIGRRWKHLQPERR